MHTKIQINYAIFDNGKTFVIIEINDKSDEEIRFSVDDPKTAFEQIDVIVKSLQLASDTSETMFVFDGTKTWDEEPTDDKNYTVDDNVITLDSETK